MEIAPLLTILEIIYLESSLGPWIVFEYMALGDLAQLLRASNKATAETSPRRRLNQVKIQTPVGDKRDDKRIDFDFH